MKRERVPYDVINTDETINYSRGTAKNLGNSRAVVSIVIALSIAIDSVLLALMSLTDNFGFRFAMPIITIVVDVILLGVAIFTNFKFKYSNIVWIGYCAASILLPIGSAFISIMGGEVATVIALTVNVVAHLLNALMVSIVIVCARKKTKIKSFIATVIAVVVIALSATGLSAYYVNMGVWGQDSPRTVVYKAVEGGYEVVDILQGKANSVTIKSEFNGKPVIAINAKVFTSPNLSRYDIQGSKMMEIVDWRQFSNIKKPINISVDKNVVNDYRDAIYKKLKGNGPQLSVGDKYFINGIAPSNLDENQAFIKFDYEINDVYVASMFDKLTPCYVVDKGWEYSASKIDGKLKDLILDNQKNDLQWAYNHGDKIVMDQQKRAELQQTKIINGNTVINIAFDRVYRASITENNDTLFKQDSSWTTVDDSGFAGKYFTAKTSQQVFNTLPKREGFDVSFCVKADAIKSGEDLVYRATMYNNEVEIRQIWTMLPPKIDALTLKEQYVYGDAVSLGILAYPKDFIYTYRLYDIYYNLLDEGENVDTLKISDFALPSYSGDIRLEVIVSHSQSSLVSFDSKFITLNVAKKVIGVSWNFPNNQNIVEFDGNNKNVTAKLNKDDIIGKDNVTIINADYLFVLADKYNLRAVLSEDWASYYELSESASANFTILPKKVSGEWVGENFVYNGYVQSPQMLVKDIYGNYLSTIIKGSQMNAGENITVTANANDRNYAITNDTFTYSITKKEYIPAWSKSSLVYNGANQTPMFYAGEGDIRGEAFNQVYASAKYKDVGQYTVKAMLPATSNFYIASQNADITYSIIKKEVVLSALSNTFVYDGKAVTPNIYIRGAAPNEDELVKGLLQFDNKQINVGNHTTSVSLPENCNYSVARIAVNYVIVARELTIKINNVTKTYDGNAYTAFTYDVINLAETDSISQIFSHTFSGTAVGAVNAGNYVISMNIVKNAKANNYKITVIDATLTIASKAKQTSTAFASQALTACCDNLSMAKFMNDCQTLPILAKGYDSSQGGEI